MAAVYLSVRFSKTFLVQFVRNQCEVFCNVFEKSVVVYDSTEILSSWVVNVVVAGAHVILPSCGLMSWDCQAKPKRNKGHFDVINSPVTLLYWMSPLIIFKYSLQQTYQYTWLWSQNNAMVKWFGTEQWRNLRQCVQERERNNEQERDVHDTQV